MWPLTNHIRHTRTQPVWWGNKLRTSVWFLRHCFALLYCLSVWILPISHVQLAFYAWVHCTLNPLVISVNLNTPGVIKLFCDMQNCVQRSMKIQTSFCREVSFEQNHFFMAITYFLRHIHFTMSHSSTMVVKRIIGIIHMTFQSLLSLP